MAVNWIYVLQSEGFGRKVLEYAPDGWEQSKVSIKRSPTYGGLFRSFNTALKFVKDGRDYIQNVYETKGTDYEIEIGIYQYYGMPTDKYLLFFSGLIDLSTYKIDEFSVECTINESSLARKLMARDDVKININRTDSIEGQPVTEINQSDIKLHQRELLSTAVFGLNPSTELQTVSSSGVPSLKGFTLPMTIITNDIENIVEPYESRIGETGSWFWGASGRATGTLRILATIQGTAGIGSTDTQIVRHFIALRLYSDTSLASWSDTEIWSYDGELEPGKPIDINIDASFFNLTDENVIALVMSSEPQFGDWTATFTQIDVTIQEVQFYDTTDAKGYLVHEVANKLIEVISDQKDTFKSNFYGREDIGYESDGEGSLSIYMSGKQIRGFDDSPSISLTEFFKSENSIYGLGLGIEHDEVGRPYVRLEKRQHFYNGNVICTINGANEVSKEVAREWIYNEVEVGYAKAEYEEVNGLEEYNNRFNWTTEIRNIKNKLSLVSSVRADGYGIEFARRKSAATAGTEDTQYDNDVFKIIVTRIGNGYQNARSEGYDFVENIFSPGTAYNLDITPGRMLRNNGDIIRAGIEKTLGEVKFQYAEQKSNLRSQKTGQAAIDENADIDHETLNAPLWIPEIYTFKSVLTREQLAAISRNPGGIVKFSPQSENKTQAYYYGWIIDVEGEPESKQSTWRLIRVNTKNTNVKIVDPDGSTPGIPPIVVDPSGIVGVFEGSFEFIFAG